MATTKPTVKDVLDALEVHKLKISKIGAIINTIGTNEGLQQGTVLQNVTLDLLQGIDSLSATILNLERPVPVADASKLIGVLKNDSPGDNIIRTAIDRQPLGASASAGNLNSFISQLAPRGLATTTKFFNAVVEIAPTPELQGEAKQLVKHFDDSIKKVIAVFQ